MQQHLFQHLLNCSQLSKLPRIFALPLRLGLQLKLQQHLLVPFNLAARLWLEVKLYLQLLRRSVSDVPFVGIHWSSTSLQLPIIPCKKRRVFEKVLRLRHSRK